MAERPRPPVLRGNVIDRAITFFSPTRGLHRANARFQLMARGAYTGARSDEKALREYQRVRLGSADADSIGDLNELRKRSRDLARNNPIAAGAMKTNVRNVVGTGLVPRPTPDAEYLGITDEQASAFARQVERVFWAWARTCDIERKQPFWAMQGLVLNSELESGDLLTVRRFVVNRGDVLGLKLQIIEADRVCNQRHALDTPRLRAGVEMDQHGAPIWYHVLNRHPGDYLLGVPEEWSRIPAFSRRDGSRITLHTYRRTRPGQTRGIPYLAPVILALKQLGRFTDAELYAAVIAGMNVAAITRESDDVSPPAFAGDSAEQVDEAASRGEVGFDYGAIWDLEPGEDVKFLSSNRPNTAFDPFVMAILRHVGAALEIPLELLVLHFTRSYSSARASLLEAWKAFRTQRDHLAYEWCQPVYEWVVTEAVARGLVAAPGFFRDPLARMAWLECEWRGPSPGQIDPLKEVQAAEKRVQNTFSTVAAETAELTGGDFENNVRQRAREIARMREVGISVVASDGRPVTAVVEPDEDEDEEVES